MSNIANPADTKSLSYRFRSKRDVALREFLLEAKGARNGPCRIVDLGGGAAYWQRVGIDWLSEHGFEVTCINKAEGELSRDTESTGPIQVSVGDASALTEYQDNSFDIVHSNSVIEHVGEWRTMRDFADTVRRLAPAYYFQTPYFWFPVDPHFFRVPMIHWLPASLRAKIHLRVRAGWGDKAYDTDHAMRLAFSNAMLDLRQMRFLFPDADMRFERVLLLPKSIVATRLPQ